MGLSEKEVGFRYIYRSQTLHTLKNIQALPGVPQCAGHRPADRQVTSSIPSQGTYLGCRPGPWLGVCKKQ